MRHWRNTLGDLLHLARFGRRVLHDCESIFHDLVQKSKQSFVVLNVHDFGVLSRWDGGGREKHGRREVPRSLVERRVGIAILAQPGPRERTLVAIARPDNVQRTAFDCTQIIERSD